MTTNFIGAKRHLTALSSNEREELIGELCETHLVDIDSFIRWLQTSNDEAFFKFQTTQRLDQRTPAQRHYLTRYEERTGTAYDTDMGQMAQILFANRSSTYPDAPYSWGYEFTPNMDAVLMMFADHMNLYKVLSVFDTKVLEDNDPATLATLDTLAEAIESGPTEYGVVEFAKQWIEFFVRLFTQEALRNAPPAPPKDRGTDSGSGGDMGMDFRP